MNDLLAAVAADLLSTECAGGQAEVLAPFAPLIGRWTLTYSYRNATGVPVGGSGYVNFAWGLGGRALVDIWAFENGIVGTTIRFYDAGIDGFRSTWICPARNAFIPFVGRAVEGRIVLNAVRNEPAGRRIRWCFQRITAERFSWTGEVSDDGTSWLQVQEIEGTRVKD
jgi:hypothetical protein